MLGLIGIGTGQRMSIRGLVLTRQGIGTGPSGHRCWAEEAQAVAKTGSPIVLDGDMASCL